MTSPRMIFGALALSGAALLTGCSRPLDPQAVAPVAVPQTTVLQQQAAPDEPLTASTNFIYDRSKAGHDVPVKGVEACINAAKEHTYRSNQDTTTSCIGSNGKAFARFYCNSPSNAAITCRPF